MTMSTDKATVALPTRLAPGEVVEIELAGERVIFIGTTATGIPAILCPIGWQAFQRWKLTTFRLTRGALRAAGVGRAGGFCAGKFLLGAPGHHAVFHRNGNPLDVRLSNIVSVPRGLLKQAKIEAARGPDYRNPDVCLGEGRRRAGKPPMTPSAHERIVCMVTPPAPAGSR